MTNDHFLYHLYPKCQYTLDMYISIKRSTRDTLEKLFFTLFFPFVGFLLFLFFAGSRYHSRRAWHWRLSRLSRSLWSSKVTKRMTSSSAFSQTNRQGTESPPAEESPLKRMYGVSLTIVQRLVGSTLLDLIEKLI